MSFLNRNTGEDLGSDIAHVKQSIHDILSTPVGTRVMLREYGSDLPYYVDRLITEDLYMDIYQASAEALDRWEKRFKLTTVKIDKTQSQLGKLVIDLEGIYLPTNEVIRLDGIVVKG